MAIQSQTEKRRTLSIAETARTLGISRASLYRAIADGRIKTLKFGARRLVAVSEVDALVDGNAK